MHITSKSLFTSLSPLFPLLFLHPSIFFPSKNFLFWDKISLNCPKWELNFWIFCFSVPECWNYRNVPPCLTLYIYLNKNNFSLKIVKTLLKNVSVWFLKDRSSSVIDEKIYNFKCFIIKSIILTNTWYC